MNDDRLVSFAKAGSCTSSGESQEAIQYISQNPKKKKKNWLPGEPLKMGSESEAKKKNIDCKSTAGAVRFPAPPTVSSQVTVLLLAFCGRVED